MPDIERQIAVEAQTKFQFYLVALVFTVLGLAVQTAPTDGPLIARCTELLAWVLLFFAGLAGLSHLEWNPPIRIAMANRDDCFRKLQELRNAAQAGQQIVTIVETGQPVPIQERITMYDGLVKKADTQITVMDRKSDIKYQVLRWLFVAGLVSLGVSRGAPLLSQIAHRLAI